MTDEALKRSEERFRSLFENISDAVIVINADAKISYLSPSAERFLGYKAEETIGHNAFDFVHPDDLAKLTETFNKGAPIPDYSVKMEYRLRHKDGSWHNVEVLAKNLLYNRAVAGVVLTYRDITERKKAEEELRQSEEKMRLIFESMTCGILVTDLDRKIIQVNEAKVRMHGYNSKEELIGRSLLDLIAENDRTVVMNNMKRRLEFGDVTLFEYTFLKKTGEEFPAEVHNAVIRDSSGNPVGFVGITTDITEHKRAEEALRESEERYRTLVELGGKVGEAVIMLQDTEKGEGIQTFVSDRWLHITGYSRKELLDKPFFNLLHPRDQAFSLDRHRRKMRGEVIPELFEMSVIRNDGNEVQVELTSAHATYRGRDANVLYVRDITRRKQTEQNIIRVAQEWRVTFDSIIESISIIDRDFKLTRVNKAFADALGKKPQELAGKTCYAVMYGVNEPCTDCYYREVLRTRKTSRRELFKQDWGIWIDITASPVFDEKGEIVACIRVGRDITERKQSENVMHQSEEKLRLMFESIADGVIIAGLEGKIIEANEAKARMHGFDSKAELLGRSVFELSADKDHARINEDRRRALKGGFAHNYECTFLTKDGKEFPGEISLAAFKDASGNPVGTISISRDISERKRRDEQLIITDRLASIGELSSGIAHELNNPLTSIIGFSQLLLERNIPDDIKEDLITIHQEAQRTAQIVRNLLSFARKHEPARQWANINSIVERVLQMRAYGHKTNNIQVNTRFDPELPEVMADGFQLQQVFLNIIINAEYFMIEAHGRGILTITTEKVGDIVRISLTDDGPGISKENLKRIFNPFFTTKEVGKGTGLGLSICHGIVTAHNGEIYAESELGKGTTFFVELPIQAIAQKGVK